MSPGIFFLFVLFAIVVGGIGFCQYSRNQKRIQQLEQFCLGKGWRFAAIDDSYAARWSCPPFFQGRDRHARDVVSGTLGQGTTPRPFVAFDYSYVTDNNSGRSSSSTTHRYAICAMQLPAYLPALEITPENALTRLGNVVVSDVLPPRTMQALLQRPPLHFRIVGCDVLCWEPGVTTPVALLDRLTTLTTFVGCIPEFVWHDYGPDEGIGGGTS
jgi:hypothetical protein